MEHINKTPEIEYDQKDPLYEKVEQLKGVKKFEKELNKIKIELQTKSSRKKPELEGDIEFKNVWFRFPTRKNYTLKNLNLKFKVGTNCAIVGTSGSGKSTIFQLLLRFYDVNKGEILINGVNIKDIELKHLRGFFGLIKQEPEVLNGTIRYNIQYNCGDKTLEEIENACEVSNSKEFIELHQEGLNRDVGNRGDVLSGGQKQRLTIARAVMRNPKVFLFDEATSALDTHSEKIVQEAIEKIWGNHSSLTIAHRISTIKHCDQIFVIDKGLVEELGTYEQLMEKKGLFYMLATD